MSAPATDREDPFRLGWRYVREIGPDGVEVSRQVPLTERDLLFPQEEDHVVQRDPHIRDMIYLREALRVVLRSRENVHVFADHRIDFNLHGVEPLGPDVAVVDELPAWDGAQGTLYLEQQGRVLLVGEITSPDTRENDFRVKRGFYQRAGVPIYVIVDRHTGDSSEAVALLVLRLGNRGYEPMAADEQGRVRIPQLRLSIGIEDEQVWLYQRSGERVEEMPRLYDKMEAYQRQVEEAREALELANLQAAVHREQFETQMELEIDLRQAEAAARREAEQLAAEAATRAAEAVTRAAEADARAAEADARAVESQTRLQHEAEARRLLEQRLRDLEARFGTDKG